MASLNTLLNTIQQSPQGLSLAELLACHPLVARRTAQRWISQWLKAGQIRAVGQGRARRYWAAPSTVETTAFQVGERHSHYQSIPFSADSQDILAYVDQPVTARRPVEYQRDFLAAYQPNQTYYLSASLRQQLRKMGATEQIDRPAGTYGRAILNRLLIDLSWASSHLEGNTYSLLDTRVLIEQGQAAQGKAVMETQMILNHKAAIELLVEQADAIALNRFTLMNLHSTLSENLLPNPADEGQIRQHRVGIGKSVFRPLSMPVQISEMLDMLLAKAGQVDDPFEQSFFMMVHLPYLQPFADVNKRTSRLMANVPLIKANLCPLTFLDVSEQAYSRAVLGVYELTRIELLRDLYVWAYERATQEYLTIKRDLAEPDPLRLAYRDVIKDVVSKVVRTIAAAPAQDPMAVIQQALASQVPEAAYGEVESLVISALRRLHEGVLARYGLRLSELAQWRQAQQQIAEGF